MISLSITEVLLLLLVGFLTVLYLFGRWEDGHFRRRGIKTPPIPLPYFGNLIDWVSGRKHYKYILKDAYDSFPNEKYFGFREFRTKAIVLRDLELIKQVAIKDFDHFADHDVFLDWDREPLFNNNLFSLQGQKWREMRSTLTPAFTSSKMKGMFEFVTECAEQLSNYLIDEMKERENKAKGLVEVELKDLFTRYSADVIATCAFGVKVDSYKEKDNDFYTNGKQTIGFATATMSQIMMISFPPLVKLLRIPVLAEHVGSFFKNLVLSSIDTREKKKIIRPDMIHLLMEAKKGKLDHKMEGNSKDTGFSNVDETFSGTSGVRKWTNDTLVAQALVFFVAGFDTSSQVECFTSHQLAVHPDVQKRLQEEVDEVYARNRGKVSFSDINGMKYMDMVISETMRLWPGLARLDRKCVKPYKLPPSSDSGSKEVKIGVNEIVWIPVHAIHHDPQYYENPSKFDPERFSDENKVKINPMTYMPFGVGPRNCIGSRFALMSIKAIMFFLLLKFDFVPTAKTQIPLKMKNNYFFMVAERGFWVGLKPRIRAA